MKIKILILLISFTSSLIGCNSQKNNPSTASQEPVAVDSMTIRYKNEAKYQEMLSGGRDPSSLSLQELMQQYENQVIGKEYWNMILKVADSAAYDEKQYDKVKNPNGYMLKIGEEHYSITIYYSDQSQKKICFWDSRISINGDWYTMAPDANAFSKEFRQVLEKYIPEKYPVADSRPIISEQEVAGIKPAIKKWIDFHQIDLAQARIASVDSPACFNCPPDTTNMYYREFIHKENAGNLVGMDYSPNKQRYVNLGIIFDKRDGKYICIGWDDCQEIYLVDRKLKHQNMVLWLGSAEFAEAVFWKNNDVFIIAGTLEAPLRYFIRVFNIAKQTRTYYEVTNTKNQNEQGPGYMEQVNLKEKGIFME